MSENASSTKTALVLLAAGAEEMEVVIVVDVLRRGGVEVVLAGLAGATAVTCSRGVRIEPDRGLAEVEGMFDLLVLPGGVGGMEALAESAAVGALLREHAAHGRLVGAICAAPAALVRHGVFAGEPMTSHPSVQEEVGRHGVWTAGRVVSAAGLTTSMGPGTAFEFGLALLAQLCGEDVAEAVRAPMLL